MINVGYDSANYYLLGNGRGRLLVDCGWPGTLPKLFSACKRMSVDPAEIGYLLVTHFHPDHAGLAQELKNKGLRLILPEIQLAGAALMPAMIKPTERFIRLNLKHNLSIQLEDSRAFLAGIGFSGQIVSTPGHSDDSISLVLDDGSAFTGDLHPPAMVDPSLQEVVTASWQAIRAAGAQRVYPGHGPQRLISDVLSY